MKKSVSFPSTKFSPEIIREGFEKFKSFLTEEQQKGLTSRLVIQIGNERWSHDSDSEFFSDYSNNPLVASFYKSIPGEEIMFDIDFAFSKSEIGIAVQTRSQIEEIHQIFAQNADKCILRKEPESKDETTIKPIIFLGHGRSNQWRDLKDHLQDKHEYRIEAYEVGERAGHTIRDILEEMLSKSSFALLVMTAEDKGEDGLMHARENVIHELGLFQGKLGFPRAIVLLEEGTNEFSNIHGIHQVRFSKDNIREAFGDVLATLKREFECNQKCSELKSEP